MTRERWQQITGIFHEALTRDTGARRAFVAARCGNDSSLRRAVESMLDAHDDAGSFGDTPAFAAATSVPDGGALAAVALSAGTRVGPYEVDTLLGVGGMAAVYRARDTKLGREVALKVLLPAVANDPDRLARFGREARLLASLNHPNIAQVHGFEETDGVHALVMELVDGPTLADRIGHRPIAIDEALTIAKQIAEALAAAHEQHVIHRDLKPANIKVRPDGTVKVLDFGLAKLLDGPRDDFSGGDSLETRTGIILGTVAYMSPEQARGKPVDRRGDLWAFGCVLFEMLTGRRAFDGHTSSDVVAHIIERDPDWQRLPRRIPAPVHNLLKRCLQKDPSRRLDSAAVARFELEDALASPPSGGAAAAAVAVGHKNQLWRTLLLMATAAAAAVAATLGLVARDLVKGTAPAGFGVRAHRLTDFRGLEQSPAISSDGKSVAFVAYVDGHAQIFVRLVVGGSTLQLTREDADHLYPRWSPDSASIIYYRKPRAGETAGALWEMPALGGGPRRIAASVGAGDISHDGKRVVFPRIADGRMQLAVSTRDGADVRMLTALEPTYYYSTPRWSFDDGMVAYVRGHTNSYEVFVVSLDRGEPRQLTEHGARLDGLTWASDGSSVIFSSSRGSTSWYLPAMNLWRVGVEGGGLHQLTFGEASYTYPDINARGTLVVERTHREYDIWRYPIDQSPLDNVRRGVRLTQQTSAIHTPSLAPADTDVVYLSDGGNHANLSVMNLQTQQTRQITYETDPAVRVGLPLWSPDGRHIAYFRSGESSWDYFLVNPDGSNPRLLAQHAAWAAWSPDSQWLYFSDYPVGSHLRKVRVTGGAAEPVRSDSATRVAIATDGRSIYYAIELPVVSGGFDLEIRVARPESGPSKVLARMPADRAGAGGGFQPVISPDGTWLALALVDGITTNLWALSTSTGLLRQLTDFGDRPTIITRRVSWSADGRYVFAAVGEADSDVVLLEGLK